MTEPVTTYEDDADEPPIVQGVITSDGDVAVRCPYCSQTHHHGAASGHRHAHCGSGYRPANYPGYVIEISSPAGAPSTT